MRRYSVKPITKREKVLYALLTEQEVSATELRIILNCDPNRTIQVLKWEFFLKININKISTYTSYELLDYQKGFDLYQHWLTHRQDITHRHFLIFDDWVKGVSVKHLAQKWNTHITAITDIVSSMIREGALLLYKND